MQYFKCVSLLSFVVFFFAQSEQSLYTKWKLWAAENRKREEYVSKKLASKLFSEEESKASGIKNIAKSIVYTLLGVPESNDDHEPMRLQNLQGKLPKKIIDIINHLNNPQQNYCEKAVIFYGPSGVGKSTFAEAIAIEVGAVYIFYSGSEFVTKYQGSGPENLREAFGLAMQYLNKGRKVVFFIDEIDGLCESRASKTTTAERKEAIDELLTQLTKLKKEAHKPIVFIGATNYKKNIDNALKVQRFAMVKVKKPDQESRVAILEFYLNKYKHIMTRHDIEKLAKQTENFCAAELQQFVLKAKGYTKEHGRKYIRLYDFLAIYDECLKNNKKNIQDEVFKKKMKKTDDRIKLLQEKVLRKDLQEKCRQEWRTKKLGWTWFLKDLIAPYVEHLQDKQKDYEAEAEIMLKEVQQKDNDE